MKSRKMERNKKSAFWLTLAVLTLPRICTWVILDLRSKATVFAGSSNSSDTRSFEQITWETGALSSVCLSLNSMSGSRISSRRHLRSPTYRLSTKMQRSDSTQKSCSRRRLMLTLLSSRAVTITASKLGKSYVRSPESNSRKFMIDLMYI